MKDCMDVKEAREECKDTIRSSTLPPAYLFEVMISYNNYTKRKFIVIQTYYASQLN